jgi:hypothetical protein
MDVDDARHQREAAGIDDFGVLLIDLANRGDAAALDRDIGADRAWPSPSITVAPRITRSCIALSSAAPGSSFSRFAGHAILSSIEDA